MTDRRRDPDPDWTTGSTPASIGLPVADLLARPDGPRDRQLLFGDKVTILGQRGNTTYLRSEKDGYHGFVTAAATAPAATPTHRVSAPATHVYTDASIKSPDRLSLSFGSRITATGDTGEFLETGAGYIPKQHLQPADTSETDPAAVATLFLGTPYLWGGNSRWGIDCSGLVQTALLACGSACPGDSDLQLKSFGKPLSAGHHRTRGDLLFWKGHVAMALDQDRIIHANAFHMKTVIEDANTALDRITEPFLGLFRP